MTVKKSKKSKNIVLTCAGRRDRMSLLVSYMQDALTRGIIDEWHIWNYTETPEDDEWIQSLRAEEIIIQTPISKNSYCEMYQSLPVDDSVYIKIDDDIVYIDVDGLDHLIQFRRLNRGYFAVSANIVNNPTCYLLQKDLGIFPDIEEMTLDGPHATAIHQSFLQGEKVRFDSVAEVSSDYIVPINCIAWLGTDNSTLNTITENDEESISHIMTNVIPKEVKRCICVFGPCVASHLSYTSQGQEDNMPVSDLIQKYGVFRNQHAMDPFPRCVEDA
jgi:hypothetical protein